MATLPGGGPAEDGSELRSHACGVAKVEARGHAPGVVRIVIACTNSSPELHTARKGTKPLAVRARISLDSQLGLAHRT